MIISLSQFIADDFFPPKVPFEIKTKPFDRFMYYFSGVIFFLSLVFLVFEIKRIDNTLNGTRLFWIAGFSGIGVAIVLTIILKITTPSVYYESRRRITVHLSLFLGFFLLLPATASFINHYFAGETITCKNYVIERKSLGGKRDQSSWLFIKLENGSEERLDVNRSFYDKVNEGGKFKLCTKKGKLGFDVVTDFKTVDDW
jgi:hypothetical protein